MFRFTPLRSLLGVKARASPVNIMLRNPTKLALRTPWRNQLAKRFQSTIPPPNPGAGQPKKAKGIKALMKEYGFSALGIYLALSAIDLPLFYLLIHSLGKDQIEYYENRVKQTFGFGVSDEELLKQQEIDRIQEEHSQKELGVEDVDPESQSTLLYIMSQFSWTEFAIAYTIHKSFIFIRLPITAAITPPVVKVLRGWGFKLGTDKLATSASLAKSNIKDFGTKASGKKKWFNFFF